jgi:hypothetical protein
MTNGFHQEKKAKPKKVQKESTSAPKPKVTTAESTK